jgi:hypothetical protein
MLGPPGVDTRALWLVVGPSRTVCAGSSNCEKYGFKVHRCSLVGRTVLRKDFNFCQTVRCYIPGYGIRLSDYTD